MSEKQNYDKILMVSGIVLGLGVAAYGAWTFLKLDDQYKFTTRVSEKPVEPPSGIKKAETVNQEISASHELKPIIQETQEYVGFVAPKPLDQVRRDGTLRHRVRTAHSWKHPQ